MSVRFKYYLRGCGLGILVAVVVMIAAIHSHGGLMTDDKAMERAKELGMIMPEDTETNTQATELPIQDSTSPDTQKHSGQVTQKISDTQKSVVNSEQNASDKTEGSEKKSSAKKNEKQNSETKDSSSKSDSDSDEKTVTFTIRGGEYCRTIAENLYNKGLVKDAEEFRKYMQDNDYDNLIRVGSFQLKKGMDYKEIAKVLTTKPD